MSEIAGGKRVRLLMNRTTVRSSGNKWKHGERDYFGRIFRLLCSVYALTSTCVSILHVKHARGSGEYLRQSTATPRHISKFIITFSCHKSAATGNSGESPAEEDFLPVRRARNCTANTATWRSPRKKLSKNDEAGGKSDNVFICTQMMCLSRSAISSPHKKLLHKQRFLFFVACLFKYSFSLASPEQSAPV